MLLPRRASAEQRDGHNGREGCYLPTEIHMEFLCKILANVMIRLGLFAFLKKVLVNKTASLSSNGAPQTRAMGQWTLRDSELTPV